MPDAGPTLCVLLWAHPRQTDAMADYEDRVLPLLAEHDGTLVQRLRAHEPDGPHEIQTIAFASRAGFDAYLADPRRTALAQERDRVIARTELLHVDIVPQLAGP
ncbi:MAG TPA: hypothetical protein VIW24_24510 [Aldersonia sp.]